MTTVSTTTPSASDQGEHSRHHHRPRRAGCCIGPWTGGLSHAAEITAGLPQRSVRSQHVGCPTMRAMMIVNPHATATTERRRDLLAHALAAEVRLVVAQTHGRGHAAELAGECGGRRSRTDRRARRRRHGERGGQRHHGRQFERWRTSHRCWPCFRVARPTSSPGQWVWTRTRWWPPSRSWRHLIVRQPPRTISLGRVDDRYFTFNAGLGLDAEVVAAVEERRAEGKPISNMLHVRKAVSQFFRSERRKPRLTIAVDDEPSKSGVHLVFVSNVDPWTFLHARPVRTNPGTSSDGGLGLFALTSLRLPVVLRVAGQLLRQGRGTDLSCTHPRGRREFGHSHLFGARRIAG